MKFRKISPFCGQILESFPFIAEDFDQMTEYALYCKLKEKVDQIRIGVNDLGDDVAEYVAKFDALKNYVDNYFDNLDVQDEVNNKLDEMAEDGTLQEIIGDYLDANALWCFNNVESMKNATNLVNGSFVKTLGYYSIDDNGGAFYKIREITNTDDVDNMEIIALTNSNTLIAELIKNCFVTPEMYGAYGDNTHDDTISLKACVKNRVINFSNKTYKITSGIVLESNSIINGNGAILNKAGETAFINMNNTENVVIKNLSVIQSIDAYQYLLLARNCNNIYMNNIYLENIESTPGDNVPGMWAMYLSGENITINNIKINNYVCGAHADGIHIADVQNLIIDGFEIRSGDDCIALNNPSDGNDIISNNILITNGLCSSKVANIFRVDMAENDNFVDACYKNVKISNIICDMKEDNTGMLCRFADNRASSTSTAKHDNIVIEDIIMRGFARNWIFPMISYSESDFNHYGRIVFDNIQAESYTHQTAAIEIKCDDLIVKNCRFAAAKDGTAVTSKERNFLFIGSNKLQLLNNKFVSTLASDKSIVSVSGQDIIIDENQFIDEGNNNGYGLLLSSSNKLTISNNIAYQVTRFLKNTQGNTPNQYYFTNNIYNNLGLYIQDLEDSPILKIIDTNKLRLYTGTLTANANNRLLIDAGTPIHLSNTGLVVTVRRASNGDIFNAYYDGTNKYFIPINYTVTEGQTYYAQFFI